MNKEKRLTPESEMRYGIKYKGQKLKDVPLSYFEWIRESKGAYTQLRRYMKDFVFNSKSQTK